MTNSEFQLQVVVDPKINHPANSVILGDCVEPGEGSIVYTSLATFYDDLIQGRPLPLTLVVPRLRDVSEAILVVFFLRRDAVLREDAASLVMESSLARRGPSGLAHVGRDLGVFFRFLREYLIHPFLELSSRERGVRLHAVVDWVDTYLQSGTLPNIQRLEFPYPTVLDVGTDGFVVAEQEAQALWWGWVELYRRGYLRGVLFFEDMFLASKKSPYLSLDFGKAREIFSEAGIDSEMSSDGLWLEGRTSSREAVIRVLTAV